MVIDLLTSGSKGNSCLIRDDSTQILIDCGSTKKHLMQELKNVQANLDDIQGVLITHAHVDHVSQLKHFSHLPVYSYCDLSNFILMNHTIVKPGEVFTIGSFTIRVIRLSHDSPNTVGYVISNDKEKIVYITDTGYIPNQEHPYLKNADYYIFESNHDMNMLMSSNRPMYLKQRILGDCGHLCNEDATHYLMNFIGPNTKHVVLAHISDECNTPEIAQNVFINMLKQVMWPYQITIKAMPQRTRYSINN